MSPKQELRYLGWIAKRVEKLSPAGRKWLLSWLSAYDRALAGEGS